MRICVLASGSAGNAIYIEAESTRVLVDAGLTGRQVEERMRGAGLDPGRLQAIVVSHEHSDHAKGAGVLARRYALPVWMTAGTLDGCRRLLRGKERVTTFDNDQAFAVGDLIFQPFSLSHDAADPVNFTVSCDGTKFGIATDMGVMTELVHDRLKGAELVLLESNYDLGMLLDGPYPWHLKQRIRGNHGHLANDRASEAACRLARAGMRHVVLGHLSEKNNRPDLAEGACREALDRQGSKGIPLSVAKQDRPTDVFVI